MVPAILIENGGARNPNSFQILKFQYLSLIASKVKGDTGGLARTVICWCLCLTSAQTL